MDKVFNDNVHGHIRISPLCVKIVDTWEFQRLRNLKQLGLAYLVYPGASHNRFEHSLGVCHLAGKFVDQLRTNRTDTMPEITDVEKLCVEIAALCHDLGHGPLSHTWERFVNAVRDKTGRPHWKHESSSVEMLVTLIANNGLREEFEKYQLFEAEITFIKQLIIGVRIEENTHPKPFLFQIVANKDNDIDVDKWDYFLRDAIHVKAGEMFDCQRLMASVRLVLANEHWQVCHRDKDAINIWNMFQVRARLHYQCYQHPVVKCLETMMIDALILADEAGYCIQGVPLSETQDTTDTWVRVTDHVIYEMVFSTEPRFASCRNIIQRIGRRDTYSLVGKTRIDGSVAVEEKQKQVADLCQRDDRFLFTEFRLAQVKLDHGSANVNPFERIYFYDKHAVDTARTMSVEDVPLFPLTSSVLLPQDFQRRDLLVFCTKPKKEMSKDMLDYLKRELQ